MKIPRRIAVAILTAVIVIAFVACGSSNDNNGGGASSPTCQGATGPTGPGSAACSSCAQSNCGSQLSSVASACGAYAACYQGCQCSDLMCIEGCLSKIDGPCANAEGPFAACLNQNCPSQCMPSSEDGGVD
jgi:hypothetical protein